MLLCVVAAVGGVRCLMMLYDVAVCCCTLFAVCCVMLVAVRCVVLFALRLLVPCVLCVLFNVGPA